MKNSRLPREHEESHLPGYLHERPELLLKMLEIAETRWRESKRAGVNAT